VSQMLIFRSRLWSKTLPSSWWQRWVFISSPEHRLMTFVPSSRRIAAAVRCCPLSLAHAMVSWHQPRGSFGLLLAGKHLWMDCAPVVRRNVSALL
jgi:hypothetical protein